jgi:two-component system, cell cycle response regulator
MTGQDEDERTGSLSMLEIEQQAGRDQRRLSATLTCLAGRAMGRVFKLESGITVIGRLETADIQMEDEGVSRKHAQLAEVQGGFMLRDLGSTNGTMCNGVKITQPMMLRDGDRVRLGRNAVLRFDYQDELEEQMQSKLYDMATRDPLTGACNRRVFLDRLGSEWAWAYRHRRPCALIAIDIDHFKDVNDTYGHAAGDLVLKELVTVLMRAIRKEDLLARTGGEEFVLLARATLTPDALVVSERLRSAVESHPIVFDGHTIKITISLGMATSGDPGVTTPDQLVCRADEMLYRAKQNGRNRVEQYGSPEPPLDETPGPAGVSQAEGPSSSDDHASNASAAASSAEEAGPTTTASPIAAERSIDAPKP